MSWNYRICKQDITGSTLFSLREVYYDNGEPVNYTEPRTGYYDSIADMIEDLSLMLADAQRGNDLIEISEDGCIVKE
jgi:hypothetical protein